MIPQWHRGSAWAVAHARRFRDEVAERVASGAAASSNERVRLMWIGAGLWHDPGFYSALEERYGAVFVWSMYMPFAGPQYIRELHDRPHARAGQPRVLHERGAAPAALDERLDGERSGTLRHRRRGGARSARQPPVAIRHAAHAARARSRGRAGASALRRHGRRQGMESRAHGRARRGFLRSKGLI